MHRALFQRIFQYLRSLLVEDSWKSLKKSDVLFFSHDTHHLSLVNSLPFSPLLDSLRAGLEEAGLRTERVGFFGSRQKKGFGGAGSVRINRKYAFVRLIDLVRRLNKKEEGQDHNLPSVVRFFSLLLTKSEAKVVIAVGVPIPLALATRNTNLHLVEVLHGFGYSSIPWDYMSRASSELPREVWVGDPLSHRTFMQLANKGIVRTLTSPLQLEPPPETGKPKLFPCHDVPPSGPSLNRQKSRRRLKKVVFATSRGGRFGMGLDTVRFDWELLNSLVSQSSESVFWFFRFHPTQMAAGRSSAVFRKVSRLAKRYANCDWEWVSKAPPSLTFKQMDSLLTLGGSEVVYDAHYSGLNSGVVLPRHVSSIEAAQNKTFNFLAEKGTLAFLPPDTEQIINWVLKQERSNAWARKEKQAKGLSELVHRVHNLASTHDTRRR